MVLGGVLLNVEFAFFSDGACLSQYYVCDGGHQFVYFSCVVGTYMEAAHAGDANFLIHDCRIFGVYGSDRA